MNYQVINHQHIFASETDFIQCHASTICLLPDGTLGAAWFAGAHEKAKDVAIWFSKREGGEWSRPVKVAEMEGVPCWNPVLYQYEKKVLLFYKTGNEIPAWQTWVKESTDSGKTWGDQRELVEADFGGRGPVKNKCITLKDYAILAPASTEEGKWECFADRSEDGGRSWQRSENVPVRREDFGGSGLIQPTLWQDEEGIVHMLMRSSEGAIYKSTSADGGRSWTMARRTSLPNNNCGIDVTRLEDGRLVLVCNPVSGNWAARSPIAFMISDDNGETWSKPQILDTEPCDRNIERAEFSYPAVISKGNEVYITYTWKRRTIAFWQIRFPEKRSVKGLAEGIWPVMITPFTPQGEVDYKALQDLTEWYISQKAAGLFAVCLSGEMEMLTQEERVNIAAFVKKCAAGRVPIAATANFGHSVEEQIDCIREMAATKVDVVVLSTNALADEGANEETLKQTISDILNRIPDVSFGLYECPYPWNRQLSPQLVKWCAQTERFVFLKETSQDAKLLKEKIQAAADSPLKVYNADATLVLDSLRAGGHGYCGSMLSFHPELYVWLMKNYKDDRQLSASVQQIMTISAQIDKTCYPQVAKYALSRKGLTLETVCRRKSEELSGDSKRAVDQMDALVADFLNYLYRQNL